MRVIGFKIRSLLVITNKFKVEKAITLLFSLVSLTCGTSEVAPRSYPVIDTKAVTQINQNGANLSAEVLDIGNGIVDHGFIYDDQPDLTIEKSDRISLGERVKKGIFSAFANSNLVEGRNYFVKAYAIAKTSGTIIYGQQVEFISLGGSPPEIKDFTPRLGSIGDTVLLIGSGFSNTLTNNFVSFGGDFAEVVKATADSLWCIIPENTPLGETNVRITLGEITSISELKFSLKALIFTAFFPSKVSFGDTVTISGVDFPRQKKYLTTTLLGGSTTIVDNSSTNLRLTISNDVIVPKTQIKIVAGIQTITSTNEIELLKPIINNFTPLKGVPGTEIIINGNNFNPVRENNKIEIQGIVLPVLEATKTTLKTKLPAGITPGNYNISITVATQTTTASTPYEIVKPGITTISPLNGTWGNTVTISGEYFSNSIEGIKVMFDNVQALITKLSFNEINVIVPSELLIKSSLITVISDSVLVTFSTPFNLDPPVITSFTPEEGKSKTLVKIFGENFNSIPSNQIVKFGNRLVEVLSARSNEINVRLPESLIDSAVFIEIQLAEQSARSNSTFHLISPWKRIADFDHGKAYGVGFSIGNYGYVTLGSQPTLSTFKPCWRYDPTTNYWMEVASFSFLGFGTSSAYTNQIAFSINDHAYAGLGQLPGGGGNTNNIMKYSTELNTWSSAAAVAEASIVSAVAYVIDGKGYVASGTNGQAKMWEYSPQANTWHKKADLPGSPRFEATGFTISNKAYLVGGQGTFLLEDCWSFNAVTNSWTRLADFPGPRRISASGFSINGIGYLIGGNNGSYLNDFWMYNPVNDNWTQLENFPGIPRSESVVFEIDKKVYYGTGLSDAGLLKDFWEFDPSKL